MNRKLTEGHFCGSRTEERNDSGSLLLDQRRLDVAAHHEGVAQLLPVLKR